MDPSELRANEILEFVSLARSVCETVEHLDSLSEIEFLTHLDELLPALYSAGCRLPNPWPTNLPEDEQRPSVSEMVPLADRHEQWKELRNRIGLKLGWHRVIQFVYDPVGGSDREVIGGDVADILADIYLELREGTNLFDSQDRGSMWRALLFLELGSPGWGRSIAEAMLPIHSLVHFHYNEDDKAFDI